MTDDFKLTRRLNHAQGEALIALRHTVVCWPPKSTKEAALFDCSALQIAKEDVEAVQRVLKERDEALRREPRPPYAWDGVAEVRPFGAMEKNIVEGVY